MIEQHQKRAAQKVARGIAPGVDQQKEKKKEIHIIEALTVDLRGEKPAGKIIRGPGPFLLNNSLPVTKHGSHGFPLGPRGEGLRGAVNRLRQGVELSPVVQGQTHELGNDIAGHLPGHVLHEIAPSLVDHRIDDLLGEFFDPGGHGRGRALGELAAD